MKLTFHRGSNAGRKPMLTFSSSYAFGKKVKIELSIVLTALGYTDLRMTTSGQLTLQHMYDRMERDNITLDDLYSRVNSYQQVLDAFAPPPALPFPQSVDVLTWAQALPRHKISLHNFQQRYHLIPWLAPSSTTASH